jgi:molecular chaperone GrpE
LDKKKKRPIDETPDLETAAAAEASETVEEPQQEISPLDALQGKCDELNDKYLRLMAEYDNFRKRSQREREDIYPNATAAAVGKFLPVLDNFERAAAFPHAEDDFGKGFDLIYQGFQEVLKGLGVEAVGEAGETFDPAFHNAVMHIEDEALGENVISQVLQRGYRIGDKVIRYAMVQTAN